LPILLQSRLLRVLQEKQVMRIGDSRLIPVDVRVICATNRDLRSLVRQNQFRGDLYFRIAMLSLYIPPLNERVEDVEVLSEHFLKEFASRYRKGRMKLTKEAIKYLQGYEFEGNVRELQGMIERAVVISEGKTIGVEELTAMALPRSVEMTDSDRAAFPDGQSLEDVEKWYIGHILRHTNGSVAKSSSILGIDRTTLWRRIKSQGITSAR
jgi:transcriptional regulator with PAS, ATPase and Fis domain